MLNALGPASALIPWFFWGLPFVLGPPGRPDASEVETYAAWLLGIPPSASLPLIRVPSSDWRATLLFIVCGPFGSLLVLTFWLLLSIGYLTPDVGSILSLCAALFLVATAILLTWYLLRAPSGETGLLETQVDRHPFCAISTFLGQFLAIAYLLAISLAFHDHALQGRALAVASESIDDAEHPKSWRRRLQGSPEPPMPTSTIRFNELSLNATEGDFLEGRLPDPKEKERIEANLRTPWRLACKITKSGESAVTVSIVGMTTADWSDGRARRYRSNYELSEARATRAENWLRYLFDHFANDPSPCPEVEDDESQVVVTWSSPFPPTPLPDVAGPKPRELALNPDVHVEWFTLPVSSDLVEGSQLAKGQLDREHAGREACIYVTAMSIPTGCELNLPEYIYFTIYTTTTTDYGDIIPVPSFAKFFSSLENLIEFFFVVVLSNALLASSSTATISPPSPRRQGTSGAA